MKIRRWNGCNNYLYDREAKLLNEQIIDFVSYRLAQPSIGSYAIDSVENPDITNYIHNPKNQVMTVEFGSLRRQPYPQQFHSESVVNSFSLTSWLCSWICQIASKLRPTFEELRKISSCPPAHLIKTLWWGRAHRTTGFSSQDFMKNLIDLASYTGIHYDQVNFILIRPMLSWKSY